MKGPRFRWLGSLLALLLLAAPAYPLFAQAATQAPATSAAVQRIQARTYNFQEAGQEMEYQLFVPSSYRQGTPTPLIILLHGLGSTPQAVIRYQGLVDLAEERGYIVAAPMGYNTRGWYGSRGPGAAAVPATTASGRQAVPGNAAAGAGARGANPQAAAGAAGAAAGRGGANPQGAAAAAGARGGAQGNAAADPPNLGELSEKDVLNVLGIVRQEFTVDANRIYLAGHSMGGGGTWHIGIKYPDIWAALGPVAPAIYTSPDALTAIRNTPVIVIQGDADNLVNVEVTREWVAKMRELGMRHSYVEIPGGDHTAIIARNPDNVRKIFDFFDQARRN